MMRAARREFPSGRFFAVRYAVGIVGMFDNARSPYFARDIELTRGAAAQISTALGYREQLHP